MQLHFFTKSLLCYGFHKNRDQSRERATIQGPKNKSTLDRGPCLCEKALLTELESVRTYRHPYSFVTPGIHCKIMTIFTRTDKKTTGEEAENEWFLERKSADRTCRASQKGISATPRVKQAFNLTTLTPQIWVVPIRPDAARSFYRVDDCGLVIQL